MDVNSVDILAEFQTMTHSHTRFGDIVRIAVTSSMRHLVARKSLAENKINIGS